MGSGGGEKRHWKLWIVHVVRKIKYRVKKLFLCQNDRALLDPGQAQLLEELAGQKEETGEKL